MSKGAAIDLGLNEAYNDLFSTQAERDSAQRSYVIDLPAAEISGYRFSRPPVEVSCLLTF